MKKQLPALPWHVVEQAIQKEAKWLLSSLDFGPFHNERDANSSLLLPIGSDTMIRQICIAIVSGKLRAREYISATPYSLWTESVAKETLSTLPFTERHGGERHRMLMQLIKKHYTDLGFKVVREPYLNHGRADLGVYKKGFPNLYVEVGSTSLYKTWINLLSMPKGVFLFVPSNTSAFEFCTNE
jgi:hypothetical protein